MFPIRFTLPIASLAAIVVAAPSWALPLSPGDRFRVFVPSDDQLVTEDRLNLTGIYEVNLDGTLQFPYLDPIPAAGREISDIEKQLTQALINKGFFRADVLQLTVKIVQWAPIQVTVAGEVFEPGRVLINSIPIKVGEDERPQPRPQQLFNTTGESPTERFLSSAIRQAGGLKPDADLQNIRLVRGNSEQVINLAGVFTGEPVNDVPLIAGDQIIVPQMERPQNALVRPSQLTPANVTVLLSNLTEPARRGSEVLPMPYGSRLSQAVVAANCAGGNKVVNARRRVSLVQTDRLTGQTKVLDHSVEALLRNSTNSAENPFLMPQDSVICYDSTVSTASGVLRVVSDIFSPFFLIQRLFTGNN